MMNSYERFDQKTRENNETYKCGDCKYITKRIDRLKDHRDNFDHDIMIWENKRIICKECGATTLSIARMKNHINKCDKKDENMEKVYTYLLGIKKAKSVKQLLKVLDLKESALRKTLLSLVEDENVSRKRKYVYGKIYIYEYKVI